MIGISATTRTYAGGGDYKSGGSHTGASGGGGAGGINAGGGGVPNTGGGAGGKVQANASPSASGASGIVLIRYVVA